MPHPQAGEVVRFVDGDFCARLQARGGVGQLVLQPLEVQVVGHQALDPAPGYSALFRALCCFFLPLLYF